MSVRRVPLRQWLAGWELAAFAALIIFIHMALPFYLPRMLLSERSRKTPPHGETD